MDNSIKFLKIGESADYTRSVMKVGTSWCSACKNSAPLYKEFASKYGKKGIKFYEVDADKKYESKNIKKLISQVQAYPTFFFFKDKELVGSMSGLKKEKFIEYLESL